MHLQLVPLFTNLEAYRVLQVLCYISVIVTYILLCVIFFCRTCKDSDDKAYADCSIAQEKSNAEINVELGISDASDEEDNSEDSKYYKESEHQHPMCMYY